jgi:hypothetical protein
MRNHRLLEKTAVSLKKAKPQSSVSAALPAPVERGVGWRVQLDG